MIKTLLVAVLIVICIIGAWAYSNKGGNAYENLDPDAFEVLLKDKTVQLLDVRTAAEYADGHIAGSINADVLGDNFAENADTILDSKRPVAVYCKSGRRSRNAAKILNDKGYKVYNLDTGIIGWANAKKDIVTE